MKTVIKVENLSKQYRIGTREGYKTFRETLVDAAKAPFVRLSGALRAQSRERRAESKSDKSQANGFNSKPYAPSSPPNGSDSKLYAPSSTQSSRGDDLIWALKDVSFEVKQGEVLGIIGRNGAGKSTLLKILSRITEPTEGRVELRGRVGSLLEVGTGFHPELTGHENIYLYGAILGMDRWEITRKFEEIVAFAELEKFIDTPVKKYSSGMYMRLAFAVAAHLEPEILLVDEVLAVGDLVFQKKCLGKMSEVARGGRTVLFVSHQMNAVRELCDRGIVLQSGKALFDGFASDAVAYYVKDSKLDVSEWSGNEGDENIRLLKTWVRSADPNGEFHTAEKLEIGVEINILKEIHGLILGIVLLSEYGYELAYRLYDDVDGTPIGAVGPGILKRRFIIPENTLSFGNYKIEFDIGIHMVKRIIKTAGSLHFHLENTCGIGRKYFLPSRKGWSSLFRPNWPVEQ